MRVHQSFLDDCGRRLQFKQEDPAYFGGSVRAMGSGYHKSLEMHYLMRQDEGFFEPDENHLLWLIETGQLEFQAICEGTNTSHVSEEGRERGGFIWNKNVPTLEDGFEMIDKMVRAYFGPEGGHWPADWQVLGVEQFFDLPWLPEQDLTRGGSIDLIMYHPETDTVVGDDQKTAGRAWNKGKEKPRKNIQGPWYSWAIRELYPDRSFYKTTFSIMTYGGKFERREATPSLRHINAAAQLLFDSVTQYKITRANGVDMPANPSSTLCSPEYCDYFDRCPHGSVLD